MRLAVWRAGRGAEKTAPPPVPAVAPAIIRLVTPGTSGDLDLRALGNALRRRRAWIIVPTVVAMTLSVVAVNLITPRYKSEARILIEGRE